MVNNGKRSVSNAVLLAAIDERTKNMEVVICDFKKDFKGFKDEIQGNYVRKEEFDPVRKVVFGLIAFILLSFAGAVVALIFI